MWRALRGWWRGTAKPAGDRDASAGRNAAADNAARDRAAAGASDATAGGDRAAISDGAEDRAAAAASNAAAGTNRGDAAGPDDSDLDPDPDAVTALGGDELDLHTFAPREVADVVAEYVTWAAEQGKREVRIIHGKGTGTLRRVVHAALARHPLVERFALAGERSGSWGATFVILRGAAAGPPRPHDEPR